MTELSESQQRLANALFTVGAIQFGEFRLKHHEKNPTAPLSPILLNLRTPDPDHPEKKQGPLTPVIVEMAAFELATLVCAEDLQYTQIICGIPNAGDPFAEALSKKLHIFPIRLLRLMKEGDDTNRRIVGIDSRDDYRQSERVLLVDDLITKADSKFEAIDVLTSRGLVVKDLFVLVDREQGGREQLEAKGYTLHAAFTLTQLLDFYVSQEKMCRKMRDKILTYTAANR